MLNRRPHPDRSVFDFGKQAEFERMVEARVALRAEVDALRWRFRLVVIETLMMTMLVAAVGAVLGQPVTLVTQAAALVGATCFVSGLLLIALSRAASRLMLRFRRRQP